MTLLAVSDRTQETANNIGLSVPIVLLGAAAPGLQSFQMAGLDGEIVPYTIEHETSGQWEVGSGEYVAATHTLNRTTIYASSTGGMINFANGLVDVWVDLPAEKAVMLDADSSHLTLPAGLSIAGALDGVTTLLASGAATLQSTLTVTTSVLPAADNAAPLGSSSKRWSDLRAVTATLSGLLTAAGGAVVSAAQTLALAGAIVSGAPTWSSAQAITLSTAAQPNVTSVGTLTGLTMGGTIGAQSIIPNVDNTYALGSASFRWSDLRAMSATFSSGVTMSSTLTIGGRTYTFPGSEAANGFLQTNGSGTLSWVTEAIGISLASLSDVSLSSNTNGQVLTYNSATSKWNNNFTTLITGVGALTAGSIGVGFGNINNAGNSLTTGALVATTGSYAGALTPATDNLYALGTASFRWSDVQALTGTFGGAVIAQSTLAVTGVATFTANPIVGNGVAGAALIINGGAGTTRQVIGRTNGVGRWNLVLGNGTAESGSNAGSDFALLAVSDAGAGIDNPIAITRASAGVITLGGTSARPVTMTGALTVNGALTWTTDATYDIGAAGANRARNLFLSGNITAGGTVTSGLINGQEVDATASFTGTVQIGTTLGIGAPPVASEGIRLRTGTLVAASALAAGINIQPNLQPSANGDFLVGMRTQPTVVTPGSFTGVTVQGIRIVNVTSAALTSPGDPSGIVITSVVGTGAANANGILINAPTGATTNYILADTNHNLFTVLSSGLLSARGANPIADNTYALGTASFRWSDFRTMTMTASGAAVLQSTLDVTGATTLHGLSLASGSITLADTANVSWGSGTSNIQGTSAGGTILVQVASSTVAAFTAAATSLTGTLGVGGTITSTGTGASNIYSAISGTTNAMQHRITNTGGDMFWGIENSAGGGMFSGSSAYATVFGSINSTAVQFATNDAVRWSISASGHFVAPTDNTYDIGAAGATRPRNVYVAGTGTFGGLVTLASGLTLTGGSGGTGKIVYDATNYGVVHMAKASGIYDWSLWEKTGATVAAAIAAGTATIQFPSGVSGNTAFAGSPTIAGTLGVAGLITATSANNRQVFGLSGVTTGYAFAEWASTGADMLFGIDTSTGGAFLSGASAYSTFLGTNNATALALGTNATMRWQITASGHLIAPDNTYDIGANGATRPRNVYVAGNGTFGGNFTVIGGIVQAGTDVLAGSAEFILDTVAGNYRFLSTYTAGVARWNIGTDNGTESGGNAGSGFAIYAYDDGGGFIDTPFVITRALAGRVIISRATTMSFYGAGAATFDASGNITSVSDERHKTDIRPFRRGMEALRSIRPITYKFNEASGLETFHDQTGFSAQNVRDWIPEAVSERADGILSFADRPVLAAVVNAMQEMDERLSRLEQRAA